MIGKTHGHHCAHEINPGSALAFCIHLKQPTMEKHFRSSIKIGSLHILFTCIWCGPYDWMITPSLMFGVRERFQIAYGNHGFGIGLFFLKLKTEVDFVWG